MSPSEGTAGVSVILGGVILSVIFILIEIASYIRVEVLVIAGICIATFIALCVMAVKLKAVPVILKRGDSRKIYKVDIALTLVIMLVIGALVAYAGKEIDAMIPIILAIFLLGRASKIKSIKRVKEDYVYEN